MITQIGSLVFLLGVASAGVVLGGIGDGIGVGGLGVGVGVGVGGGHGVVDLHTPPKYQFNYGVVDPKTGDKKQQSEVRVNDVVKGEYSLAEPDGTIRVVKYTADDHNGFNAVVSRVGHAAHPQVLIRKAVVPVAHSVAVPVAAHGIAIDGLGLGRGIGGIGLEGGLGGIGLGGGLVRGDGLLGGGLLGGHGGIGL